MLCAYHSPGRGLHEDNALMLDTQINLGPMLTALLSSSWTYLAELDHDHLDSEDLSLFLNQGNHAV